MANFGAKDGVLTAQQFVIDTDPVRVDGSGTINLRDETLDLRLQGKPKKFQFVRLRAPITVKGSLAHPVLGVEAGAAMAQGGIGAALAFINPLAAMLAFIDPGLAKDANCGPLLATAKAQGAPVKASAVGNARPQPGQMHPPTGCDPINERCYAKQIPAFVLERCGHLTACNTVERYAGKDVAHTDKVSEEAKEHK